MIPVEALIIGLVSRPHLKSKAEALDFWSPAGTMVKADLAMIQVALEALQGVPVGVVTPNGLTARFQGQVVVKALAL